jgi:uncharacterized protein
VSKENVELVRDWYREAHLLPSASEEVDYGALFNRWASEVEIHDATRPDPSDPEGVWRGYEGARRYSEDWIESFESLTMEPEELIDQGDRVVVRVRARAKGRGSGIEVENERFQAFTVRGGKVVRFEVHTSRESALAGGND